MAKKTIVVVGASMSGLLQSHSILKHAINHFPEYHLILINPSPDFYFVVGGPRAIIDGKLVPDDKVFLPIAEGFKQYPRESYTIVQGTVTEMNPRNRSIRYSNNGETHTLHYDALILASGGKTPSPLFTSNPSTEETRSALRAFRDALPGARKIVIGGGGACGVECAGEIGDFLNGHAGWFSSRPSHPKAEITIVTKNTKILPTLSEAAATRAEKYLIRVGANVLYGRSIVSTSPDDAGRTIATLAAEKGSEMIKVHLDDGQILEADIYIPAFKGPPTSSYIPSSLLTPSGHVRVNPSTLRVDDAGPLVYALGDVSSAFSGGSQTIAFMVPVITANLKRDLRLAVGGKEGQEAGKDRIYERETRATQFVPVGRSRGVGQLFGWWLPSWVVWILKGRTYMTGIAGWYVRGTLVKREG